MDSVHVEDAQQKISGGDRLGGERQMTAALELAAGSARQDVGDVVVQVLVGIAHVGSVQRQRMIQQVAVTVGRVLQFIEEVGQALHVIAANLGVILDAVGVLGVVRSAME